MAKPTYQELEQRVGELEKLLSDFEHTEQKFRRQKDLFELVINSAPDRIFWKDLDLIYIGCNVHFAKDSGMERPEDVIGKNDYDLVWKEEADVYRADDKHVISTGKPKLKYEEPFINKNGEKVIWLTSKMPLKNADGKIIGLLAVSENITEWKQAEEEKRKLESKLHQAQKMESIGNLAGGIAHDFNNILASVIGFTELSFEEAEKGSVLEDNLQEIYSAGKRAKDVVSQILAFARQSQGEVKPVQLNAIAKEFLEFIRSSIPATIEIKHTIDSHSFVMGNWTQIYQVFMNLFTNAADAMEDSGGLIELSIEDIAIGPGTCPEKVRLQEGDYIRIQVYDTGKGISPEILHSIFEPYFTTKGPGEGSGMGLAVVYGIVKSYGGAITVNSELSKGTTVTIYLPVTEQGLKTGRVESEKLPGGNETILFVDDEAPIATMCQRTLERLGYSVETRTGSIEALELFKSKPDDFDLVISDMTMPNMTGDILSTELMRIRPDLPVILCTGYNKKNSEETVSHIGIKGFVQKPMVKADLAKIVRKVLDEVKREYD